MLELMKSLWENNGSAPHLPLLFLNATDVESGQRVITNPIDWKRNDTFSFNKVFSNAINTHSALGNDLPLSAAAHLSARFTYVSSAGAIKRDDTSTTHHKEWIRVVDGGYFENSGSVTGLELIKVLNQLERKCQRDVECTKRNLRPVVIRIDNYPKKRHYEFDFGRNAFMNELLPPFTTLFNTRTARGAQAVGALEREVSTDAYHPFGLCERDEGATLPLGWMLAKTAQREMTYQLLKNSTENNPHCQNNLATLETISAYFE